MANPENESSRIRTTALTARYGVTPRLGLILSVPYRDIRSPKDKDGSAAHRINRHFSGLGDSILLGQYRLNPEVKANQSSFSLLAGLRLPTGSADPNHFWTARDGSRILSRDAVLQPGFGTYDPILGLQWNKPLRKNRSLYLAALYRHTGGTNPYGYRFGSEFQVTAGASLPLGRRLTFTPQFVGQISAHDYDFRPLPGRSAGQVANTGGEWVYFMPTLRYGSLELNVQLPIYRNTNGPLLSSDAVFSIRKSFSLPLTRAARGEPRRSLPEEELTPFSRDLKVISRGERVDLAGHAVRGKTTLVQFTSPGCSGCKEITPRLSELLAQRPDVALRQVFVAEADAPVLAQHGIEATPSFLLMDRDGQPHGEKPLDYRAAAAVLDRQLDRDWEELQRGAPLLSQGEPVKLEEHIVSGKVTVFLFFSPTCETSRSMSSAVRHLLATDADVAVKLIDVSDDTTPVVTQHGIEVTPTFSVYSRRGQLVGRLPAADYDGLSALIRKAKRKGR